MENLDDLYKEFIIKALGEDIKVSPSCAEEFFDFCEEKHCIPSRLEDLSARIKKVAAFEDKLSDRFIEFCQTKRQEGLEGVRNIMLSFADLCEHNGFIMLMESRCEGKYFNYLQIECSLKFVRFWLMAKGLVSEKTFQELEAQGVEKAVIDELKQINNKNKSLH